MGKSLFDQPELGIQYRSAEIDLEERAEDGSGLIWAVASTETEVRRWYGIEILDHSSVAVDMTRVRSGAPVLVDHFGDQVGVIEGAKLSDRKLRLGFRFSKNERGQEIERDVRDRVRRNVSIGYMVEDSQRIEIRADGTEVFKVTKWQPYEMSIVGVPADIATGVGRSEIEPRRVQVQDARAKEAKVDKQTNTPAGDQKPGDNGGGGKPEIEVRDFKATEQERAEQIIGACRANGLEHLASEYIASGMPLEQIGARIALSVKTRGTVKEPTGDIGKHARKHRYSYSRAILQAAGGPDGKGTLDGVELEVHQEMHRRFPGCSTRGGVLMPMGFDRDDIQGDRGTRVLQAGVGGKGAEVVFEQSGDLIELLRPVTAVIGLGATTFTGLTGGPIGFPKQTAAASASWTGENVAVSLTDATLQLAQLAPKTLIGATSYTRQLLMQGSLDVENFVRNDFAAINAIAIDRGAIHGLGAGSEPTGIYKASGVSTVAFGGAATYSLLKDMQGKVALQNAIRGSLGWLTHTTIATNLGKLLDFASSGTGRPIWDGTYDNAIVAGYRAAASNNVSNTMSTLEATGGSQLGILFGNWADLIVGLWGAMEVVVDPMTKKTQGVIEVATFQMADVLTRRGESFCVSTGCTG